MFMVGFISTKATFKLLTLVLHFKNTFFLKSVHPKRITKSYFISELSFIHFF